MRFPIRFARRIAPECRIEAAAMIFAALTGAQEFMASEADVRLYWEVVPTETGALFLAYPEPPGLSIEELPVMTLVDAWLDHSPVQPNVAEAVTDE